MPSGADYLFSTEGALSQPATRLFLWLVGAALVGAPLAMLALRRRMSEATRADAWIRYRTWLVIAPAFLAPLLLMPFTAILAVAVVSILCYREFARATGFFRHRSLSAIVVVGILLIACTSLDHWYDMFMALTPLTITVIAAVAVLSDSPHGYLQRVSLASVAFLLFGSGLGHLGYIANDPNYRPILLLILVSVQLNDVFAYICGKSFGRRKLFPNTSPGKTLGGHLGALVLTTAFAATTGHFVFEGTLLDRWPALVALGLIISVGGQLGDLVIGSIKRDIGVKDMASTLPGHGGFLDRMNSSLLVAPAVFHFVGYALGYGLQREPRVFTAPLGH
ncbi:MAG: phosphatidate cytidylyltransferase [Phycisphaerales bacterium]